ncbi:hypothetical protein N7462_009838 [Penicillium macrosclerotiorum]|uniref:uncharacterized protein n=1 Tax=Penicillium macrosclerotiorum TaxID=303699 RepID=UPI0025486B3C|nr:uncharacterized protein N7462_009838 [Penicillium macrosclerotiorum]KAJ5668768.1 hypothetical protein N7462_009838 [Penicillium macrosclerotiorum]
MASISAVHKTTSVSIAPPASADAFAAYSQDISRAIMTATHTKPSKLHQSSIDGMPPAPPPSPVSFAIDSNRKASQHEKIPSLSLE